jgi:flagellar biogenesis protein FliO
MDIIETLPIGQNRMLLMVRILDEIYLISQTASSITMLDKIGGQKAMDIISSSKGGGTIMHFKDAFNSFMGKMKKPV